MIVAPPDLTRIPHDRLLAEQRQLTARKFASQRPAVTQASHTIATVPLNARPGERYAFEVNLDKCSTAGAPLRTTRLASMKANVARSGALFGESP
jgi:hypothetical protein